MNAENSSQMCQHSMIGIGKEAYSLCQGKDTLEETQERATLRQHTACSNGRTWQGHGWIVTGLILPGPQYATRHQLAGSS